MLPLSINTSQACDSMGKTGFAPENDMKVSRWALFQSGMSEERFSEIIKLVKDVYTPVFAEKDAVLVIHPHWADDTVNANANTWGKRWVINIYGGIARHPLNTEDGFTLVLCHELGHFVGGPPKVDRKVWASNEGQADYFGAMKCMRRILEKEDNEGIVAKMSVDLEASRKCDQVYNRSSDRAICKRIAMAGKALGHVLGSLHGKTNLSFSTPDTSVVAVTNENHPDPQCRMDTYFQGILCNKSYDQDIDNADPRVGNCIASEGYNLGLRPRCWYAPTLAENRK